ncbi:MAG: hypothetical protein IKA16_04360 [Oscillospiraceae bacterium]|nr:hypothetical protein [Oscillospiraceae bacterium]
MDSIILVNNPIFVNKNIDIHISIHLYQILLSNCPQIKAINVLIPLRRQRFSVVTHFHPSVMEEDPSYCNKSIDIFHSKSGNPSKIWVYWAIWLRNLIQIGISPNFIRIMPFYPYFAGLYV